MQTENPGRDDPSRVGDDRKSAAGRGPADPPLFGTLLASRPRQERKATAFATAIALVTHVALVFILVRVTSVAGDEGAGDEEVVAVMVPIEEAPEPPPPPPPPRVEAPVVSVEEVQGFQTLAAPTVIIDDIPPPTITTKFDAADFSGIGMEGGRADGKVAGRDTRVEAGDASAAPVFTPFTVAPRLTNPEEVARALERTYPPLLRDAGIGGEVIMWFFIDETGAVIRTQVNRSSGYPALDQAAQTVAGLMRFSPAFNRDRKVQVWVQIPIKFATR